MSRIGLLGRGARVVPPRAMPPVSSAPDMPDIVEQFDDIAEAVADRRKRAAINAAIASKQALEGAAEAAVEAASTFTFKFSDVISSRGMSFLESELQQYLRQWRSQRITGGALVNDLDTWVRDSGKSGAPPKPTFSSSPVVYAREVDKWSEDLMAWAVKNDIDDVMPGSPLDYAKRQRSGSPDAKLQLFLGAGYRGRLPGVTVPTPGTPCVGARWSSLAARVWPAGDAASFAAIRNLIDIKPTDPNYAAAVERLRNKIEFVLIKTRGDSSNHDITETVDIIQRLVKRYRNADDVLDEPGLRKLMGRKDLTTEDFLDRVVTGINIMRDECDLIAPNLIDELLTVPGIESFIETVVRRSGHEHGYRFEVFVAFREIFEGADPANLWMQVMIDGKMGPDIVRVFTRQDGTTVGRIVQAKSYRSLTALLSPAESGKIREQILSDIRRIQGDGFRVTGPNGNKIPVDPQIDFKIDWWRLRMESFDIPGIDPNDLKSLDTAKATAAREAFYNRHVKAKVEELNDWMASPEFRAEMGLGPYDPMPTFNLRVELTDQIVPSGFTP